jgi:hypothetical protein
MTSLLKLCAKRLFRSPLHFLIRDAVSWEPLREPVDGYSVVIACMKSLAPVAVANLQLCARQDGHALHELILVFDCPPREIPLSVVRAVDEAARTVRVRLLGYDRRCARISRLINWGWVYSWLSWTIAIGEARTRAVIIHDLDAIPLDPGLFERLYHHWVEERAEFCGIRPYRGNGVTEDMGLVTTYELVLDAAYLRSRFRPFDLFNKLRLVDGRVVDYDTMLFAESQARRALRPVDESQLVHPSQLICNYIDLVARRSRFQARSNTLPMLPYYFYLGGEASLLESVGAQIAAERPPGAPINFLGHDLFLDGILPPLWAFLEKLIRRTEQALYQRTRPEIEAYLAGFIRRAGDHRSVGREVGANAVAEY